MREDRPAPGPRTLGGRERGRALNRGPITPDRRRAQPQRPPVPAACDLRLLIGIAPIPLPTAAVTRSKGPRRRLAAHNCQLLSREIGVSSAEFSITHFRGEIPT